MHKTTRTVVKLAACGVAFAIPMLGAGSAFASPGGSSLTVNGTGVAKQAANQPDTKTVTTGTGYGADSGTARTILLSKFGPTTAYAYDYSYNGESYQYSYTGKSERSTGTVIAITKVGSTLLISRFNNASSSCGTYRSSYTQSAYSSTSSEDSCSLRGTGDYVARGQAITAGLPGTGSVYLNSRQGTNSSAYSEGGPVYRNHNDYGYTNLNFNNYD